MQLLSRIIKEKAFTAKFALRLCYANSVGDDILLYKDPKRESSLGTIPTLRQQKKKVGDQSITVSLILLPHSIVIV